MKNITLFSLYASNCFSRTPLISNSVHTGEHSFSIQNSKFVRHFSHIFYSISLKTKTSLYRSLFKDILSSAVKLGSEDPNEQIVLTSQFNNEKRHLHMYASTLEFFKLNIDIDQCRFQACSGEKGGAMQIYLTQNVIISRSNFEANTANIGGVAHILYAKSIKISDSVIINNHAKYYGGIMADGLETVVNFTIFNTNFSKNHAELWGAALRLDRCGGSLKSVYFMNNNALVCGAFFDFSCQPNSRDIVQCVFDSNNCTSRSAVTCFHILQKSTYNRCIFVKNNCVKKPNSIEIQSINTEISIIKCAFDGPQETEIGQKFEYSKYIIQETQFNTTVKNFREFIGNIYWDNS